MSAYPLWVVTCSVDGVEWRRQFPEPPIFRTEEADRG